MRMATTDASGTEASKICELDFTAWAPYTVWITVGHYCHMKPTKTWSYALYHLWITGTQYFAINFALSLNYGNLAGFPRGCSRSWRMGHEMGRCWRTLCEERWWYHWALSLMNSQPVFGHSCLPRLLFTQPALPLSLAESNWKGLPEEKLGL